MSRSTAPVLEGLGGRCRLLGIFAHPDDETFCAGGTFARYAERGAEIMVVSATRGQAGQIRDAAVGNRRTIAAVREAELRLACERLGITKVRCLDYVDGTLADAEFSALVDEIAEVICEFEPDVVITFGPDGGYGHPDHLTISAVTTAACQRTVGPGRRGRTVTRPLHRPPRLYYRCFPSGDLLILERLATWLTSQPNRFAGSPNFAHALLLLAEASGTMRHIRDHIQVRWYPPGSYVVEQGEEAAELFLILSGEAEVWQESSGRRKQLRRQGPESSSVSSASPGTSAAAPTWWLAPVSPVWFCLRPRRPSSLAGAREPAWPAPCPARRRTRPLHPETCRQIRASSPATCPNRSCVRSRRFPPTAASSPWNRTCSRSSCYRRCSAANIS
jgi:LmbE family N-acetylglucosaminyl deacetylase